MKGPDERSPASPRATQAFAEFLLRRAGGDALDFDAFCDAQGEIADGLRALYGPTHAVILALVLGGEVPGLAEKLVARFGRGIDPGISLDPAPKADPADPKTPASERLKKLGAHAPTETRYRLEGEVARGGMGAILKVWDEDLRRHLAMKVVLGKGDAPATHATLSVDPARLARFLEEAQVTGQLDHPGIVPVHELGLDSQGRVYFTMRLVKGHDLEVIFRKVETGEDGWNPTRALGVILRVCEAMAFAHAKGVIHRDLKPENVMVGAFGEVYVMDWGLARVLGNDDRRDLRLRVAPEAQLAQVTTDRRESASAMPESSLLTMDGDVVGTPAYMPPEQARGNLEEIGPASDVYAVGAILYRLLTGARPHVRRGEDVSVVEIWKRARKESPAPIHSLAAEVPAELAAICEKAMAREIAARYPSIATMAEDLRAYLEHRVVRAYETGAVAEFKKWVSRNKGMAASIAAAAALAVGGLAAVLIVQSQANADLKVARDTAKANEVTATTALADVLRLSDVKRLNDYREEADELWPAQQEKVPAMEAWLGRARDLAARIARHRATLDELRAKAIPDAGLESKVASRRTWRFSDTEAQWQHDTLASLVAGLESFVDGDPSVGTIADVTERLHFARTVRERSFDTCKAEWNAAIASIGDAEKSPLYKGLALKPQLGLVPVGRDPGSGLWEFGHLATGAPPVRGADGTLQLTDESSLVFVLIPGGSFDMGAERPSAERSLGAPNVDPQSNNDEGPVHRITLAPFFLSKHEMTQGQWLRATRKNPSLYGPGTRVEGKAMTLLDPVEQVSWQDCDRVLTRLDLALPTEAQWEYGARAGTMTPWWTGSEKESVEGAANLADSYAKKHGGGAWSEIEEWLDDGRTLHATVGSYRPNAFGLHDTMGNVWEWCRDPYVDYENPVRAGDGLRSHKPGDRFRVNRGGGFNNPTSFARSALRYLNTPEARANLLGVRPARAITE